VKCKTCIKKKDLANILFLKNLYKEAKLFLIILEPVVVLEIDAVQTISYLNLL